MKIGILTFHWANNYGAVLQSYALQNFLEGLGHQVDIINYHPKGYSHNVLDFVRPQNLLRFSKFGREIIKTIKLDRFRNQYLNLTNRIFESSDFDKIHGYDVLISGSDQVLNPFFTINGEGSPTSAYYLTSTNTPLKIGYAVSFGCNEYPVNAISYARQWIQSFNKISVRENSGIEILKSLRYKELEASVVVPDPVILDYKHILSKFNLSANKSDYYIFYLLHDKKYNKINSRLKSDGIPIKTIKGNEAIEEWMKKISRSEYVLTNSYHGAIVSILSHSEFAVIIENDVTSAMNDRFMTLLSRLNLLDRIVSGDDAEKILELRANPINWEDVDRRIKIYSEIGAKFLKSWCN